jgi:RNA polymerase-binding transcription factor DksA
VTFRLSEPADRADPADLAQAQTEIARELALRQQLAKVEIGEDQLTDERDRVICLWCLEPIEQWRLDDEPHAVRHKECQEDHEKQKRFRGMR